MSIATTSLKYGWKVLAILTIGAGSIFVADNVLNRITTRDRIEVTLAVVERCLGTQYGTNGAGEPLYRVAPPSIVRTWTDTDGASISMTNAIAWRDDLSMKIELDAKIKALVPHYIDTNSVYDGTTNIVMLTVTGLWASLNIGDGTNKFTAIPGWTNAATTNYSGTNAISTNAATTNIVSYGPWAWRNYLVAWEERYKVLEALKVTEGGVRQTYRSDRGDGYFSKQFYTWDEAKQQTEDVFVPYSTNIVANSSPPETHPVYSSCLLKIDPISGYEAYSPVLRSDQIIEEPIFYCTNMALLDSGHYVYGMLYSPGSYETNFNDNGLNIEVGKWKKVSFPFGLDSGEIPVWCEEPISFDTPYKMRGCSWKYQAFPTWRFNYCTNAFWE